MKPNCPFTRCRNKERGNMEYKVTAQIKPQTITYYIRSDDPGDAHSVAPEQLPVDNIEVEYNLEAVDL